MKTLDEVITANECCNHGEPDSRCEDCPYNGIGACCAERESDALHYLKEYRSDKAIWEADRKGYLDWIEQYKEAREKHQQAVIELKKNPPLTWDEIRQMEGKPMWVEANHAFIRFMAEKDRKHVHLLKLRSKYARDRRVEACSLSMRW